MSISAGWNDNIKIPRWRNLFIFAWKNSTKFKILGNLHFHKFTLYRLNGNKKVIPCFRKVLFIEKEHRRSDTAWRGKELLWGIRVPGALTLLKKEKMFWVPWTESRKTSNEPNRNCKILLKQCCGSGSVGSICFWPPRSGSISQRYGSRSRSGSFYPPAIIITKTLIIFCDFFMTFYLWKMV